MNPLKRITSRIRTIVENRFISQRRAYAYFTDKVLCDYLPIIFGVELTNICNLNCTYCLVREQPRDFGFLELSRFTSLVKNYNKLLRNVVLGGHGESFLHPDFITILEVARRYRLRPRITTNVTKVSGGKALAAMRTFSEIQFSFDAPTKEYFEKVRVGAKYEECVMNIETFCWMNLLAGHPVRTQINIVRISDLDEHLLGFVKRWGKIVDVIDIQQLVAWSGYTHENVSEMGKVRSVEDIKCGYPWGGFHITWDGDVFPCCLWEHEGLGNIFYQTIEEIWNGEKYQEFRLKHITGNLKGTFCETCPKPLCGGINMMPVPTHLGFGVMVLFTALNRLRRFLGGILTRKTKRRYDGGQAEVRFHTDKGVVLNPQFPLK